LVLIYRNSKDMMTETTSYLGVNYVTHRIRAYACAVIHCTHHTGAETCTLLSYIEARSIVMYTETRYLSVSWARWI